ncbi:hypothetical protein ACE3MZ_21390 [Paenibacillus sp. WLX1005]|uniref:hypothetical protein n=1 Tax=unclassified Paenibacillus TaxID=185978 RepID=UPI003984467F
MNRLFTAFTLFVQKRLIGNIILAAIVYLFWMYGLQNSAQESAGTAMVAFVLLLMGDMVSLYVSKHSSTKRNKHAG